MKGAREYASLFKTGQYGRLYITSGSHARGKTFRIQVLPKDVEAKGNGENNNCTNKDAVEVYGVVGGNPGWTEVYGWLHEGPWQDDFYALVEQRKALVEQRNKQISEQRAQQEEAEKKRKQELLADY